MGFDESLFARVHGFFTRRKAERLARRTAHHARLESERIRLEHLARVLLDGSATVSAADGVGEVRGTRLALPTAIGLFADPLDNALVYRLRIVWAATAIHEGLSAGLTDTRGATALATILYALPPWARMARRLRHDHPGGTLALHHLAGMVLGSHRADDPAAAAVVESAATALLNDSDPPAESLDRCRFLAASQGAQAAERVSRELLVLLGPLPVPVVDVEPAARAVPQVDPDALPRGSERSSAAKGKVEVVEVNDEDDGQNPLAHVFEKVKTVEEQTGGNRSMDGSDELDEHGAALDELDMRRVTRSRQATASVFHADLEMLGEHPDLIVDESTTIREFHYPEWDHRRRAYQRDWCRLAVGPAPEAEAASARSAARAVCARHRRQITELRAEFARFEEARALARRQPIGTDLDLDALVDFRAATVAAERRRERLPEGRVYVARRPDHSDVASYILLDTSLSSDSWVNGRRVLDVTRESMLILSEVLAGQRLPVGVAAFFSHARRDCRFEVLKRPDERWDRLPQRLYGLRPRGYTRIGPAVRHATKLLATVPSKRRLLILLSDCKPTDLDHYEGARGIADVRQAQREANAQRITTLALSIDRRAGSHLPQMFGGAGFRILPDPSALAVALLGTHQRLLR
jgi:nitric oxide reductase activation protein